MWAWDTGTLLRAAPLASFPACWVPPRTPPSELPAAGVSVQLLGPYQGTESPSVSVSLRPCSKNTSALAPLFSQLKEPWRWHSPARPPETGWTEACQNSQACLLGGTVQGSSASQAGRETDQEEGRDPSTAYGSGHWSIPGGDTQPLPILGAGTWPPWATSGCFVPRPSCRRSSRTRTSIPSRSSPQEV